MTKIRKTVIFSSYVCNNRCIFCINANKRLIPGPSLDSIKREIIGARRRGSTYLEIIGGEPTIDPRIFELIGMARRRGFKTIMIATNGRMLSYRDFARKILETGLNSIIFSVHGHTAKLHDSLTRSPGSFVQLKHGVENIKKISRELGLRVELGTNTTIVKQNYRFLPQIGETIRKMGLGNAEFIFVDPNYGGAHDDFKKMVPKISMAAPYMRRCLDIGKSHKITHWHVRYVPLCFFSDYLDQISELHEVRTYSNVEHIAPDFRNPNAVGARKNIGRTKTRRCLGCRLSAECEGIWHTYLDEYGDKELSPVK